ncbi:hypothetical protein TorRG33x02_341370 [Trema orientale]|uniref:Pollen Ole e 1 allergen and extensin family protein n=1 Tax=Trema orientale TaxID=63057 RepID=A0A2P5AU24_TREOI|nr:hypothetical protein TorRG33x02_341370 [Trema orientale]
MAYRTPVPFLIASFILFVSSYAHRILPIHNLPIAPSPSNNDRLVRVRVPGVLRCSIPPGQPPSRPPLVAGVNVILTCDGGKTAIGDAVTDTSGFFEIVADTWSSVLFGASNTDECRVTPRLVVAACSVFLPAGFLDHPLGSVETITDNLSALVDQVISTGSIDHVINKGKSYYDPSTVSEDHIVYTGESPYYNGHSTVQDNVHV